MNGSTIAFHDFEGVPPLPLELDDDFLAGDHALPQPPGQLSFMTGFVVITRVFQLLSQCILRHRLYNISPATAPDVASQLEWLAETSQKLREILVNLPEQLQVNYDSSRFNESTAVFGTQQANIYITALCLELSLVSRCHSKA
jgi:hypothetical protein